MSKFYVFKMDYNCEGDKLIKDKATPYSFVKEIEAENKKTAIELMRKEIGQDIKVFNERQYHYFFEMD